MTNTTAEMLRENARSYRHSTDTYVKYPTRKLNRAAYEIEKLEREITKLREALDYTLNCISKEQKTHEEEYYTLKKADLHEGQTGAFHDGVAYAHARSVKEIRRVLEAMKGEENK